MIHRKRQGGVIVFCALALVVMLALTGLVVDGGMVFLLRNRLQTAVDAGALAAAQALPSTADAARARALFYINLNNPGGQDLALPTVRVSGSTHVTIEATVSYPPSLLSALGIRPFTIGVRAVAENRPAVNLPPPPPSTVYDPFNTGLFGGSMFVQGNVSTAQTVTLDSYSSALGTYNVNGNKFSNGNFMTDGTLTLENSSFIDGSVRTQGSLTLKNTAQVKNATALGNVSMANNSHVSGNVLTNGTFSRSGSSSVDGTVTQNANTTIPSRGALPAIDFTAPSTTNNNSTISSSFNPTNANPPAINMNGTSLTLSSGTYYFSSLTMTNGAQLNLTGTARIFVTGSVTLDTQAQFTNTDPKQLQIYSNGNINLNTQATIYAGVYAPNGTLSMAQSAQLYGGFVSKGIQINNSTGIHLDQSLVGSVDVAPGLGNVSGNTSSTLPAHFGLAE